MSSLQAWPTRGGRSQRSTLEHVLTLTISTGRTDQNSCRSRTLWTYSHQPAGRRLDKAVHATHISSCPLAGFAQHMPRIAIWLILQAKEDDFFVLLAVVCSSWVPVNQGTHRRSIACPSGNTAYGYVSDANCMVARKLECT